MQLLEITEVERNHELLLMVKNLRELGASPFPYIILVVPHSLPAKLIKEEHFVLTDLFKLNPGSSSQASSAQEDQVEATKGTLVRSARATQPQSPRPARQSAKKKKENKTLGLEKRRQSAPGWKTSWTGRA